MSQNEDFNLITSPASSSIKGKYVYLFNNYKINCTLIHEIENKMGYWEYILVVDVHGTKIHNIHFCVKKIKQINVNVGMHWELFIHVLMEIKHFLEFNRFDKAKQDGGVSDKNYILNLN